MRRSRSARTRTAAIYLGIDIDVVDATYAPGTGSPTVAGLTSLELFHARGLLAAAWLGAGDLCEVDPTVDPAEMTARMAVLAPLQIIARGS